jgi:hypothetical protein
MDSWLQSLSWKKNKQKLYHIALVHEARIQEGLTYQRDRGDGEDLAAGVSPEHTTRGAAVCSQDERGGCDTWRRGAMPHFSTFV